MTCTILKPDPNGKHRPAQNEGSFLQSAISKSRGAFGYDVSLGTQGQANARMDICIVDVDGSGCCRTGIFY
jgi:hypothetical protein